MCVHREINHHMVQTLAEARLLHRQIVTQPMAIRMPFAGRVRPMPIRRRIAIMIATRICGKRRQRPVASSRVVHIMPTTSKHRMDEQRSTQQAGKNGPHRAINCNRLRAARFIPAVGIYLIQTFDKSDRPSTFKTTPDRYNPYLDCSIAFSGLSDLRSIELCPRSPTSRPSISAHSFQAVSKSCRYDRFFAA